MWHRNRMACLLCILILMLLLVGCTVPFIGDKATDSPTDDKVATETNTEKSNDTSGSSADEKKPDKQVAEDPIAEPDPQENVAEEPPKGPKLTVNLPATMTTDYEKLKISGSTAPGSTVFINGQTVRLKSDGTFSSELNLSPGNNDVQVIAVDKNENSSKVKRTVTFVASKPSLSIFSPSESSSTSVSISGYTDPDCIVYLDSIKVKPDKNGSFTGTVNIKNRGNNTVKITAINSYGMSTETSKTIQGIPPKIQVAAPDMTTNDQTTITGVSDANSSIVVLIGSEQVTVNNNDGTFNITLELEPGLNDVTVLATNLFGTTEVPLTILYDDYGKEETN